MKRRKPRTEILAPLQIELIDHVMAMTTLADVITLRDRLTSIIERDRERIESAS